MGQCDSHLTAGEAEAQRALIVTALLGGLAAAGGTPESRAFSSDSKALSVIDYWFFFSFNNTGFSYTVAQEFASYGVSCSMLDCSWALSRFSWVLGEVF